MAVGATLYPFLSEECAQGYYELTGGDSIDDNAKNWFGFVEDNICGKCDHPNCASC